MRVLVTGATGFIGQAVVRALVARGDAVRCLVRQSSRRDELSEPHLELVVGDINDPSSLRSAARDVDVVFHLASLLKVPWRPEFSSVNVEGTRNVARACADEKRPPRLVIVSSLAAAGPNHETPRQEHEAPAPVSIYGRVKLASERAAAEFARDVPISIVRPPSVFGAFDTSLLKLWRGVARGVCVAPSGVGPMSLIHVDELARALIEVAERGETLAYASDSVGAGVYYVRHDETPTLAELGLLLAQAVAAKTPKTLTLPRPIFWLACAGSEVVARLRDVPTVVSLDKYREATAGSWVCSNRKLKTLGFQPRPLVACLEETGQWYRERGWL